MTEKKQNDFLSTGLERCEWLISKPERFPSLYKAIWSRIPSKKVRKQYAAIMAEHWRAMDIESQRCGSPRADGSFFGLSEKILALRTGLGDPRERRTLPGRERNPNSKHWRGRRVMQHRIAELRQANLLWWGRGDLQARGLACNPRAFIEKGRHAGSYRLYPSVRQVSKSFLQAIQLDRRLPYEIDDVKRRRAEGKVAPVVDVFRRRQRDRQIKRAWRARMAAERGQIVRVNPIAALTVRRQE